jgi:hypothetical protein
MKKQRIIFVPLILFSMIISSCSLFQDPKITLVRKMYNSLAKGDANGYLDTILPQDRTMPNPLGLLSAIHLSFSYGPFGLDLSQLTKFSINDLKVKIIYSTDDYAIVQAEGGLRYPLLITEIQFCDTHDLRKVNGRWYVDVLAPEKQARVENILAQKQGVIQNELSGASDQELFGMISSYMNAMQQIVDLCEH